jgi:hypothetical protein
LLHLHSKLKIFDGWIKHHEDFVFSSPSGNKDIKQRLGGYCVKVSCSDAEIRWNLIITVKTPGLINFALSERGHLKKNEKMKSTEFNKCGGMGGCSKVMNIAHLMLEMNKMQIFK